MRHAPLVVVGALCAQPALADDTDPEAIRFRTTLEIVVRPGSMKPPGLALAADASVFVGRRWWISPAPSVGGGVRLEVFRDREVRFGVEPTVGLGMGDLENPCGLAWGWFQGGAAHAELRPGLLHSLRTGTHLWLGGSVEGTYLPVIARVRGGATVSFRLHENPSKFEPRPFREVVANVGGGPGLAQVFDCGAWAVGRPLRGLEAEMVLPDIVDAGDLDARARAWARQAREEHAAVAAFLRLARELASVGAPAHLVRAARHAADDEVRHARACLARAATLSGAPIRLGEVRAAVRTPVNRTALLRVLRDESLRDGWLNEGRAALDAARQAATATDERDRAVHARIAAEEARHAELGWRVAMWCQRALGGLALGGGGGPGDSTR